MKLDKALALSRCAVCSGENRQVRGGTNEIEHLALETCWETHSEISEDVDHLYGDRATNPNIS